MSPAEQAYEAALAAWRADMSPANAEAANEAHRAMRAAHPVPPGATWDEGAA